MRKTFSKPFKDEYNARLHEQELHSYDVTILKGIDRNNPKFESNGTIKPFYGLTCIAWIDQQSELHYEEYGTDK